MNSGNFKTTKRAPEVQVATGTPVQQLWQVATMHEKRLSAMTQRLLHLEKLVVQQSQSVNHVDTNHIKRNVNKRLHESRELRSGKKKNEVTLSIDES